MAGDTLRSCTLVEGAKVPKARPGRPGGRRDTNRKERTQALADAGLQLFLARGIEAVAIEDIATAAGLAKGSFYRYFDDKTALVERLLAPIDADVAAVFDASLARLATGTRKEDPGDVYVDFALTFAAVVFQHPQVALLYLQESRAPGTGARAPVAKLTRRISIKALEQTAFAQKHGVVPPFPAVISMLTVIGAVERLLFAILSNESLGENVEPLEATQAFIGLVFDDLRTRGGGVEKAA